MWVDISRTRLAHNTKRTILGFDTGQCCAEWTFPRSSFVMDIPDTGRRQISTAVIGRTTQRHLLYALLYAGAMYSDESVQLAVERLPRSHGIRLRPNNIPREVIRCTNLEDDLLAEKDPRGRLISLARGFLPADPEYHALLLEWLLLPLIRVVANECDEGQRSECETVPSPKRWATVPDIDLGNFEVKDQDLHGHCEDECSQKKHLPRSNIHRKHRSSGAKLQHAFANTVPDQTSTLPMAHSGTRNCLSQHSRDQSDGLPTGRFLRPD